MINSERLTAGVLFFSQENIMNPSLSDYQGNPAGYINRRALALYTYIHWLVNWSDNQAKIIQWSEDSLTKTWGAANRISSQILREETGSGSGNFNSPGGGRSPA